MPNAVAATALTALQRNWDMVNAAVEGLDDELLRRRPNNDSNSMSWLIWHMTRVADRFIHSRLQDGQQLWVADGWAAKFGMEANPDDIGMGWSNEQAAAWRTPPRPVLLGYYAAVNAAALAFLQTLDAEGQQREITGPAGPQTVGEALGVLVWDNVVHGGQVAYLRGYFKGLGWFR